MTRHVEALKARRHAYHLRERTKQAAASDPAAALLLAAAESALEELAPGSLAKLRVIEARAAVVGGAHQQALADYERLQAKNDRRVRPLKMHESRRASDRADDEWDDAAADAEKALAKARRALLALAKDCADLTGSLCDFHFPGDDHVPEKTETFQQLPNTAAGTPAPDSAGNIPVESTVRYDIGPAGIAAGVFN